MHKYGYSSPTDGTYKIDGVTYSVGKDFRTQERYEEYRSVGLDTLLLQANDPYCGEDFETSQTKKNMDNAYKAGIRRITVFDKRINDLSHIKGGLIGKDKLFPDEQALQERLKECVKDYRKHPAFLGVMLIDEPTYEYFSSIGQIERALKSIDEKIICQCNILPLAYDGDKQYCADNERYTLTQAYRKYVEDFCRSVPQRNIVMDSYPIREENEAGRFIAPRHFAGYQIFHDVCRDFGRETTAVLQSTAMHNDKTQKFRALNEGTMLFQYYGALAFGVKELAYFTYWRKQDNKSTFEFYPDNTAFISQCGEKTSLYYAVEKIHREHEQLESALEEYTFVNSSFLGKAEYLLHCEEREIEGIEARAKTEAPVLITKLQQKEGRGVVYAVQSLSDPDACEEENVVTLRIKGCKAATVYRDGVGRAEGLSDGEYTARLLPGRAEFIFVEAPCLR